MTDKGICEKHGEFILRDGCPQCIAERQAEEGNTKAGIAEAVKVAEQQALDVPPQLREMAEVIIVCSGGCGRTTEGMTMETRQGEFVQVDESGVPEWTCPDCLAKKSSTAVALRPGEDIEAHGYFQEALKLLAWAQGRVIATVEDNKAANDDLALISKLKKVMENKRRALLDPLKLQSDAIRETYNYLMAPVLEADKVTRDKMLAFDAEQRRIRAEQEDINRKRQEAAEQEMKLTGELSESVNLVEVVPEPTKSVSTEMGTSGLTDHWKYEVTDFALLPDAYKMADNAQLTAIARRHHDQKQIPGVRFYNEPYIAVRTR